MPQVTPNKGEQHGAAAAEHQKAAATKQKVAAGKGAIVAPTPGVAKDSKQEKGAKKPR